MFRFCSSLLLVSVASALPIEEAVNAILRAATTCPADTFVDLSALSERRTLKSSCGYWVDAPECPTGWSKVGDTWEWCSWGRHRDVTTCGACSIQRKVVPKATLTTCDTEPCWLGFLPNDLAQRVDPRVSARFGGLWYMDGNPYPEEAISFHGSSWSADLKKAQIAIYKESNWAMHATDLGNVQSQLVQQFGAGLSFDVDALSLAAHTAGDAGKLLATATISSQIGWAQELTDALFNGLLDLTLELRATEDPDVIERTGTSPYTLRRFISPTGAKTAQFALWQSHVLGQERPLGPMPDLWLNEKIAVPACPGCN